MQTICEVKVLVAATETSLPELQKTPQLVSLETVEPTVLTIPRVNNPSFSVILSIYIRSYVSPDCETIITPQFSNGKSSSTKSLASKTWIVLKHFNFLKILKQNRLAFLLVPHAKITQFSIPHISLACCSSPPSFGQPLIPPSLAPKFKAWRRLCGCSIISCSRKVLNGGVGFDLIFYYLI